MFFWSEYSRIYPENHELDMRPVCMKETNVACTHFYQKLVRLVPFSNSPVLDHTNKKPSALARGTWGLASRKAKAYQRLTPNDSTHECAPYIAVQHIRLQSLALCVALFSLPKLMMFGISPSRGRSIAKNMHDGRKLVGKCTPYVFECTRNMWHMCLRKLHTWKWGRGTVIRWRGGGGRNLAHHVHGECAWYSALIIGT